MTNRLIVIRTLQKHGALLIPDIVTLGNIDRQKVRRVLDRYPFYFVVSSRGLVSIADSFKRAAEIRDAKQKKKETP